MSNTVSNSNPIVAGAAGGLHIAGAPLTTSLSNVAAPGLLRNSIDSRIVRIRPASTPLDQISRCAASRHCGSMTVEYYSVDTKKTETTITELGSTSDMGGIMVSFLTVEDPRIFDVSDTVLIPDVVINGSPLVGYVSQINSDSISVAWVTDTTNLTIPQNAKIVRMGRAASELDVQTSQFQAMPKKDFNNCQIFKMQVEQSTLQKIADKEVNWSFSDQEEAAVIDMRLGMEKNFLFGIKAKFNSPTDSKEVFMTNGIWNQTSNTFNISLNQIEQGTIIDMCAQAFTNNNGSKRKILLAGTELLQALSKQQIARNVSGASSFVKWGLEFREISSNFGSLFVVHSEIFDQCGHAKDGFIIDPDYITKYVHIPFNAEKLDLKRSGLRNTDATVLTEASCIVLRYPNAHLKVIGS